mgnify:CR=1 FL=1
MDRKDKFNLFDSKKIKDRFLKKVWRFCQLPDSDKTPMEKELQILHQTIQVVDKDLEQMKFNTALSRLMEFINHFSSHTEIQSEFKLTLIKMIAPLTPHLAEELWQINGGKSSVFMESYPKYDAKLAEEDSITIAIQVNGKLRGNINVSKSVKKDELLLSARDQENVSIHLKNKEIIKEIVVPQRLINFVVK